MFTPMLAVEEVYNCLALIIDFFLVEMKDDRICIKFCYKDQLNCGNDLEILYIPYVKFAINNIRVSEWHKHSKISIKTMRLAWTCTLQYIKHK